MGNRKESNYICVYMCVCMCVYVVVFEWRVCMYVFPQYKQRIHTKGNEYINEIK